MQKHTKIYLKYFEYGEQSIITCEACGKQGRADFGGFDIHHINGRGRGKDTIENLACLCRKCHTLAHTKLSKGDVQYIHNNYLAGNRKKFMK